MSCICCYLSKLQGSELLGPRYNLAYINIMLHYHYCHYYYVISYYIILHYPIIILQYHYHIILVSWQSTFEPNHFKHITKWHQMTGFGPCVLCAWIAVCNGNPMPTITRFRTFCVGFQMLKIGLWKKTWVSNMAILHDYWHKSRRLMTKAKAAIDPMIDMKPQVAQRQHTWIATELAAKPHKTQPNLIMKILNKFLSESTNRTHLTGLKPHWSTHGLGSRA